MLHGYFALLPFGEIFERIQLHLLFRARPADLAVVLAGAVFVSASLLFDVSLKFGTRIRNRGEGSGRVHGSAGRVVASGSARRVVATPSARRVVARDIPELTDHPI